MGVIAGAWVLWHLDAPWWVCVLWLVNFLWELDRLNRGI